MSKLRRLALITAAMAVAAGANSQLYGCPRESGMRFNPNYKPQVPKRQLREFTVKGKKIMAYSKKDAVIRLRHQK